MHGRKMGTHGGGARVNRKKSGSKGGVGMAGSGKKGDQKKPSVINKYGHEYFGKKGITSRKTKRDKSNRINVRDVQEKYKPGKVDLKGYKILGKGEIKDKFIIKAKGASKSAMEKIKKAGGEIQLIKKEKVVKTNNKNE